MIVLSFVVVALLAATAYLVYTNQWLRREVAVFSKADRAFRRPESMEMVDNPMATQQLRPDPKYPAFEAPVGVKGGDGGDDYEPVEPGGQLGYLHIEGGGGAGAGVPLDADMYVAEHAA